MGNECWIIEAENRLLRIGERSGLVQKDKAQW